MFMGPSTVAAGLTATKLQLGPAPHQPQLLRLDDGVTADQAIAATRSPDPCPAAPRHAGGRRQRHHVRRRRT